MASSRQNVLLASAGIVLAVALAFGGAIGNGWVLLDDPEYVTANPRVQSGLTRESLAWAWTGIHGGNWHPLTSLTHLLDVELFGRDPQGPHAVNVVLHALAAVLCFLALRRLTQAPGAAFVAALLFAVHPGRTESVAWIAERKDVLSGVFFFATLLAWSRWVEHGGARRYAVVAAAFAAALLSKPMVVTLPFVLLLLDRWPLSRFDGTWRTAGRLWLEKVPLFALAGVSCVVTYAVQRAAGAMQTAEHIPFGARLANAPVAVARYVAKLVWPADLSAYYPFELPESPIPPLASGIAIALALGLAWRMRETRPWLLAGTCWFLGMLVPVLGLVQVGGQAMADRYTYLPGIGLLLLLCWSAREWIGRQRAWRTPLLVACAGWVVILVGLARAETRHWRDSTTLGEHMLASADGKNALAHMLVANSVLASDPTRARRHFEAGLALVPSLPNAHSGLGRIAAGENRWADAEREYQAEIAVRPTAKAHYNLGLVLQNLQRPAEAMRAFEAALALDPALGPAQVALERARAAAGGGSR